MIEPIHNESRRAFRPGSWAVGFAAVRRRGARLLDCGFRGREWKTRTLVAGFLLLTGGVLVGLALFVGGLIGSSIRAEALRGGEQSAEVFFYIGLEPDDYEGGRLRRRAYRELDENVRQSQAVVGARLWDAGGRLLHESGAPRSGAPSRPTRALRSAFRRGVRSELSPRSGTGPETEVRTYVPLPSGHRGPARQVLELRLEGERVAHEISIRRRRLYLMLLAGAALLYLALLPTVIKASRALAERYRSSHLRLQRELRRALDHDELVLHYQPKLDLRSGRVHGVEALLRWNHPRRGIVAPSEFLAAAEETSLALTIRVFELALASLARWQRQRIELTVAINVSPALLAEPELPRQIERLLTQHGVHARDVTLEITESALGQASAMPALGHFRSLGFKLSIDDFGTGHSSLARLDTLPIDELKIDRSFISKLAEGGDSTLVAAMISLAHQLGLSVVAEGVETQQSIESLADLGCDSIQGYHLARPLPQADLPSWLLSAQTPKSSRPLALSAPIDH